MLNKIWNFFKKEKKEKNIKHEISKSRSEKMLLNINQFDDIWVKIDDNVFDGWVVEKNGNTVYCVYSDINKKLQDIKFIIERPLNRTEIKTKDDKIILLNNPNNE